MKKTILLTLFTITVLSSNAQFTLTPSGMLLTENGSYTITLSKTEEENYDAVKKAIRAILPEAQISEDYMKLIVKDKYKTHDKLPGALKASDWEMDYSFNIEINADKIAISFDKAKPIIQHIKGEGTMNIYPFSGKNNFLAQAGGRQFLFNSKGKICSGGKKLKAFYEQHANNIVKNIETHLKQ